MLLIFFDISRCDIKFILSFEHFFNGKEIEIHNSWSLRNDTDVLLQGRITKADILATIPLGLFIFLLYKIS